MTFETHWFRPLAFLISWSIDIRNISSIVPYSPALVTKMLWISHQILATTVSGKFLLSFHLAVLISSARKVLLWLLFLCRIMICACVPPCTILIYQHNPQFLCTDISLFFQSMRIFLTFNSFWVFLDLFFWVFSQYFFSFILRGKQRKLYFTQMSIISTVSWNTVKQPGLVTTLHRN